MNDEGLELLKRFVEADVCDLDFPCCPHCHAIDDEPHARDCLWVRARAYLRDQGVELEDDDE